MENKLPTMVEYVITQWSINLTAKQRENIKKFADFLSQQPNIGMFVPAVFEGGEWRVLSKPKAEHGFDQHGEPIFYGVDKRKQDQYQTALDNVIFEGFYVEQHEKNTWSIRHEKQNINVMWNLSENRFWFPQRGIKTLEDLTKYNLTLTPKFAKELGLI